VSEQRRLRRQLAQLDVVALKKSPACAAHGCIVCRSDNRRRALALSMVAAGQLCAVKAQCLDCGAFWRVELFAVGPERSLRIAFEPMEREKPN
jgi:hypothetical protein